MINPIIKDWCSENNIEITDKQLNDFERYAELLIEWNEKMNLTAITKPEEIAVKHFIDSISLLKYTSPKYNASIIDIGTGAGFPGIPLKLMRSDLKLTLLDSLNKRLVFLGEVCKELDIEADIIHARAEEFGKKLEYREKYDYAVSRAVANLPALCEYCIPYVKVGGSFISMKGPDGEKETETAKTAIEILGGMITDIQKFTLPDNETRTIIEIKKLSPTPEKYPRRGVKINKSPIV